MKQAAKEGNKVRKTVADAVMWFGEVQKAVDGYRAMHKVLSPVGSNQYAGLEDALHCVKYHLEDSLNCLDSALEDLCGVLGLVYSEVKA